MTIVRPSDASVARRYRKPWLFLAMATAASWSCWIPAALVSEAGPAWAPLVSVLGIAGLVAPLGVVVWITRHDPAVRRDMLRRLVDLRGVRGIWLVLACVLVPASVVLATLISLPFGYPVEQLWLRGAVTFTAGALPGWIVLVVAPVVEEAAWHSYGADALRTRMSILTGSIVFALIWAAWHVPLAFISGSSQEQTAEQGILHALNFPISAIPFVLLMHWIYFRSGRSIVVTILFHLAANLATQVLATHPDTEVMATGVLIVAAIVVVWCERELFLAPPLAAAERRPARG